MKTGTLVTPQEIPPGKAHEVHGGVVALHREITLCLRSLQKGACRWVVQIGDAHKGSSYICYTKEEDPTGHKRQKFFTPMFVVLRNKTLLLRRKTEATN
jgi:hypothetical protein